MNLPSDTPKLPKWIFLLGWAALLVTAWLIWDNSGHPSVGVPLVAVVVCVVAACMIGVIPFVTDYARRQDEALDERQRSLHALSVTVAAASEQVSIAATGLNGIAEAAQENFGKSERLYEKFNERMAELDARLASVKKDDGEAAVRLEAVAKKISKAAAEFEAAVTRAAEAAKAVPVVATVIPEHPPVIASKISEIKPAVASSQPPYEAPAAVEPPKPVAAPEAVVTPEPVPAPEVAAATEAPSPPPAEASAPAEAAPEPVRPPCKRSPRKPAPEAPPADLVLESPDESPSAPEAPAIAEPAVSADGATRLVVTSYIGIGNRLFVRGEGPGLSWEKGVPLTFVSIGKWRWETNDATGTVRFKLFKNDEAECVALGERTVEPGAQLELSASF
jgi:uncharacterized protein YoxC